METKQAHPSEAYTSDLGVVYTAEFVPFSKSRHAKPNPKFDDLNINWKIRLQRGSVSFTCDYAQGIGHLPAGTLYPGLRTSIANFEIARRVVEEGKAGLAGVLAKAPLTPPLLADVLYCLVSDYDVLDHPNFESWARDYGYDEDSRKAEKVYCECLAQALQLRTLFGDEHTAKLRELLEGY